MILTLIIYKRLQPPDCDRNGRNYRRRKRSDLDFWEDGNSALVKPEEARDLSMEVYSGLYVNEAEEEEGKVYIIYITSTQA